MSKRSYRSDFEAMIKKNGTQVYDHLSDVIPDATIRLSKGDFIKVVNGYDVSSVRLRFSDSPNRTPLDAVFISTGIATGTKSR